MNPPQETPETFEAILPYAVALDLADTGAARFANILADAAYEPAWTTSGGDMLTRIHARPRHRRPDHLLLDLPPSSRGRTAAADREPCAFLRKQPQQRLSAAEAAPRRRRRRRG
jgi:hypothetical protein